MVSSLGTFSRVIFDCFRKGQDLSQRSYGGFLRLININSMIFQELSNDSKILGGRFTGGETFRECIN